MYSDDVHDRRSANVNAFFSEIGDNKSLMFYYASYSNPFSEEDSPRHALIGVSRVKKVGSRLVYDDPNVSIRERYAGGMIWARNVGSHYPNEVLRLPYHRIPR